MVKQSKLVTVGFSEKCIRAFQVLKNVFNGVIYGGGDPIKKGVTQALIFMFPSRYGMSLGSDSMLQAVNIQGRPSFLSALSYGSRRPDSESSRPPLGVRSELTSFSIHSGRCSATLGWTAATGKACGF